MTAVVTRTFVIIPDRAQACVPAKKSHRAPPAPGTPQSAKPRRGEGAVGAAAQAAEEGCGIEELLDAADAPVDRRAPSEQLPSSCPLKREQMKTAWYQDGWRAM
jgi:hypothetical protein